MDITFTSLATVAGASVAIVPLVQVLKQIGLVPPGQARKVALVLGLIGYPVFVTIAAGFHLETLIVSVFVGAQVALAAAGAYDTATNGGLDYDVAPK